MVCFSSVRTASAVVFLMFFGGMVGLFTGMTASAAAAPYEVVWTHPSTYVQSDQVALDLVMEPGYAASAPVKFAYAVRCDIGFEKTNLDFRVLDAAGKSVYETVATYDLKAGENKCHFEWDSASCLPGAYKAVL